MFVLKRVSVATLACLLFPTITDAQWTTTIVSNPQVAIGACTAVRLEIFEKGTTTIPRTPLGDRVTIKDYDMTMYSPGMALSGYWLGPSHWYACGCQIGTIGTKGVITATYPAAALPANQRVPGASSSVTATISLSKMDGTFQPPSCKALTGEKPIPLPVVTAPGATVAPTVINTAPAKPIAVATTPTAPVAETPINTTPARTLPIVTTPTAPVAATPINTTPARTLPVATTPTAPVATTPINTTAPAPINTGPAVTAAPTAINTAPAPVSIPPEVLEAWAKSGIPISVDSLYGKTPEELQRILMAWIAANTGGTPSRPGGTDPGVVLKDQPTGEKTPIAPAAAPPAPAQWLQIAPYDVSIRATPAEVTLSWRASAAGTFVVQRWKVSDPACCRATSPQLASGPWKDPVMWEGLWRYRIIATNTDGKTGYSEINYTYETALPPTNIKAEQLGRDSVSITWTPVKNASHYLVSGPPSNVAIQVDGPSFKGGGAVPLGTSTWKVATVFDATSTPGAKQTSAFATTTVSLIKRHYRLVAEAVRVTTETVDQQESADGKYDEIYVAAMAEIGRRDGPSSASPTQVSAVHGDVSWSRNDLPRRVKAGTASGTGGVRGGDVIGPVFSGTSAALPGGLPNFALWEGELPGGDYYLLLHPTIWEADDLGNNRRDPVTPSCNDYFCSWHQRVNAETGRLLPAEVSAAIPGTQISVVGGRLLWIGGDSFLMHLELQALDRPIGLIATNNEGPTRGVTGKFFDKIVVLTREKLEAAIASGKNRIEIRFWDRWEPAGGPVTKATHLNGDYTLVMRIERSP